MALLEVIETTNYLAVEALPLHLNHLQFQ